MGGRLLPAAERDGDARATRRTEAAGPDGAPRGPDSPLSQLHRAYGNRRIQRSVAQATMRLGEVGDHHEREADRVAEQVVDDGEPGIGSSSPRLRIGRVRGSGGDPVDPLVAQLVLASRGRGRPLPGGVRRPFEQKLGADLGGVRVHTGTTADGLNRRLRSTAFTTGRDIYFRHGEYDPSSPDGREMLAHELVHVVQQTVPAAAPVVQRGRKKDLARRQELARKKKEDKEREKQKRKKPPRRSDESESDDGTPSTEVKRTKASSTEKKRKHSSESGSEEVVKKKKARSASTPAPKGKAAPSSKQKKRPLDDISAEPGQGEREPKRLKLDLETYTRDDMAKYLAADIKEIKDPEALKVGVVVWNINHLAQGGVDDDPEPSDAETADAPFKVEEVLAELKGLGAALAGVEKVLFATIAELTPAAAPRKKSVKSLGAGRGQGGGRGAPLGKLTPLGRGQPQQKLPADRGPRALPTQSQAKLDAVFSTSIRLPAKPKPPSQPLAQSPVPTKAEVEIPTKVPTKGQVPTKVPSKGKVATDPEALKAAEEEQAAEARQRAAVRKELSRLGTDIAMLQLDDLQASLEPGLNALLAWRKDRLGEEDEPSIEVRAERLDRIRALSRVWNRLTRLKTVFGGATRSGAKSAARQAIRAVLEKDDAIGRITKSVTALLDLIPVNDLAIAISNLKKTSIRDLATDTFLTNDAINLVLINEMNLGMKVLSDALPKGTGLSKGPQMLAKARVTDEDAKAGAVAVSVDGKKIVARQYESYPAVYKTAGKGGLASKGTFYVTTKGEFAVQQGDGPQEHVPWDKSDEDKSFRGIVVHRLVQGTQELWAGVIHTTPAGTNLNRTDIWGQLEVPLANLNSLARQFRIPLLVGGDFYISSEAMVNKPSKAEKEHFDAESPHLVGRVKTTNVARNLFLEAEERGDDEVTKLVNSMRLPFRKPYGLYDPKVPTKLLAQRKEGVDYTWGGYWSSVSDLAREMERKKKFPANAHQELGPTLDYKATWKSTLAGGAISQNDIRRNQWRPGYANDATKPGITLKRALGKLGYRVVESGDPTNPKERGTRENKAQLADLFIVNEYWRTALSGIVTPDAGQLKPVDDPALTASKTYWKISDHSPAVMLGSTTADDPALYQAYDLAPGAAARSAMGNRTAWLNFEEKLRRVLRQPLPDEDPMRDDLSDTFDAIRKLLEAPILAPDPGLMATLAKLVRPLAQRAVTPQLPPNAARGTKAVVVPAALELARAMTNWTPYHPINVREESLTEPAASASTKSRFTRKPSRKEPDEEVGGGAQPPVNWPTGQIEHVGMSCYISALIHVLASHDVYRGLVAATGPLAAELNTKTLLRNLVDKLRQPAATITGKDVQAFIEHLDSLDMLQGPEASLQPKKPEPKKPDETKKSITIDPVDQEMLDEASEEALLAFEDPELAADMQQDAADILRSLLAELGLPVQHHAMISSSAGGNEPVVLPESTIELKLKLKPGPEPQDEPVPEATNLADALRVNFIEQIHEDKRLKLTTFVSLPDVLTIVVNRQGFDDWAQQPLKADWPLDAPELLEIPQDLISGDTRAALKGEKATYTLVHMTHHSGRTTRSGHYTSYGKTADDKWYKHNDTRTHGRRTVPAPDALQEALQFGYIYVYSRNK